jgi:UDP-N-acetyl-2-amino-2-deoxyglucuronate dehydrogenase
MMSETSFALIGAAGYIAPRHMKAIKAVGGDLKVAFDPNDSVGIIDSHFPSASFFTEFERFDRHIDKMRRRNERIGHMAICSPNYLHDAHIRFALRSGSNAICEKPLVLNPWNIDGLAEIEGETGRKVSTILQLRLHPAIVALKEKIAASTARHVCDVTYIASRGNWYHASWKGDESKSGGVATNIGVHFFDMLGFVFGPLRHQSAHIRDPSRAAGLLSFEKADVRWFLSVDAQDLPTAAQGQKTTYRSITVDGDEVEFSEGFTDLHTRSYESILAGRGYGLNDVRPCIEIVSAFRAMPVNHAGERHPFVDKYVKL